MTGDEQQLSEDLEQKVDRRLQQLRDDPEQLKCYGVDGKDEIDDERWSEVRRMVTLEVQTELQRQLKPADPSRDTAEEEPIEVLRDRFELHREIGRGAQGRTFEGIDRNTDRRVAVKELLLRDVEDWKAIELFEREGETLRHLDHPHIPDYVDTFHFQPEGSGERFFLVQEFVDGTDYKALIDQGKTFTEEEAKTFLEELFEILIYLQDRSPPVIHRDIKPSNIIRRDDGELALIDFGAVQSVIPKKTGGSTIIGTSGYMPIEQLMGRAGPETDVYAAGATVVHMLSRRHPSELPMDQMRLQFESHVNVSDRFGQYLGKLLEPQAENRLSSAEEALRALRRLDDPQSAGPQPTLHTTRKLFLRALVGRAYAVSLDLHRSAAAARQSTTQNDSSDSTDTQRPAKSTTTSRREYGRSRRYQRGFWNTPAGVLVIGGIIFFLTTITILLLIGVHCGFTDY